MPLNFLNNGYFAGTGSFADNLDVTKSQNTATTITVSNINAGTSQQARFVAIADSGNIQIKAISTANTTCGIGDVGVINCGTMSGGFMIAHNDVTKYTLSPSGQNTWTGSGTFLGNVDIRGSGYNQIRIANNTTADTNKQSGITTLNYEGNGVSIIQTFQQNNSNDVYYGSADASYAGIQNHRFYVNADSDTPGSGHTEALLIQSNTNATFSGSVTAVGISSTTQTTTSGYFATSTTIPSNQIVHVRDNVATTLVSSAGGIKISSSPGNDVFLLKRWDHSASASYFALQNSSASEFITVNIQGDGLCAKGLLQVSDWKNIEGIKRTKGVSYNGAQLKGLTFDIITNGESIDFIYKNIESIVD